MIPLAVPDLRGNEAAYLQRCVDDNWVSSAGPFVTELEQRIAALTGRAHAVATVNGTAALHLALVGAGVRPGDAVIVPDWTFAATANAVYMAGAVPCFADVTEATWTLDPAVVDAVLAGGLGDRRIAAVIAVDVLGHPADMDALAQVCDRFAIPLIEDAAGAIGASYKGRPAGGLGRFSTLSFNGNKTVTAGGGGMVTSDDGEAAALMRHLSTQARPGAEYLHDHVGFNYRMTNINAAVGVAQLERLDAMLAAKRAIARRYDDALAGRADLRPMPRAAWAESAWWLYSVRVADRETARALVEHLRAAGATARVFWERLSAQPPFAAAPRRLTGVAEALSGRVVSLPCSSSLTDDQQAVVLGALSVWSGSDLA